MSQKVGIIGKGNVGAALKEGLGRAGYETKIGGKGSGSETSQWADVVILALPYGEAAAVLKEAGTTLAGKTVIDATNPLTKDFNLAIGFTTSAAEELQKAAPGVKIVKCFNSVFASRMSTGKAKGETLSTFVCGDDQGAKNAALRIARDIGFDAVDAGPLENARWVEALGFLNIRLGYGQNLGTEIGVKLVR